jgi:tetratricopeptide (TPR) repeat protein
VTISQLTSQVDKLNESTGEYQRGLSEKEETINQLAARIDSKKVIAFEQPTDEEKKTAAQVVPKTDSSDVIVQIKSLYKEGKYDNAYKMADDLRQKRPEFGLAYFVLGTIEMRRERYDEGKEMLKKAIQFGLPDEDKAWAFHNLGYSSLRERDFDKAKEFLDKAVELNSNMEKSREALKLIDTYLKRKS